MSWKETIASIEPSALYTGDQEKGIIQQDKSNLLFYLNAIAKFRPGSSSPLPPGIPKPPMLAVDAAVEFELFNDICEIKEDAVGLAGTLADNPNGQIEAGRLMEIYREATKSSLYPEIMKRIMAVGQAMMGNSDRSVQKPSKN